MVRLSDAKVSVMAMDWSEKESGIAGAGVEAVREKNESIYLG